MLDLLLTVKKKSVFKIEETLKETDLASNRLSQSNI